MVFNTRQKLFCFFCVFQCNPQISCFCFTFAFLLNTRISFLPPGALVLSCILHLPQNGVRSMVFSTETIP